MGLLDEAVSVAQATGDTVDIAGSASDPTCATPGATILD